MANNIPTQTRTVDPYSSYNSNVVNQLTRMITREQDCIDHLHAIDVVIDSAVPLTHFIVSSGQCYKDDVIVQVTADFNVNMEDPDFYTTPSIFNEAGYYHILLSYTYVKSLPAPQASIIIIKPSQRLTYVPGDFIFLKAVKVIFNVGTGLFEIDSFYDADPDWPTTFLRKYSQVYVGAEDTLPTFVLTRDHGRIIYVKDRDEIYFGGNAGWISIDTLKLNIDTSLCVLGQLVYIGSDDLAHPAIATNPLTFADGWCIGVGGLTTGGLIRLYGEALNIPIQTGISLSIGDKLYLSDSEAGTVTNLISSPYSQYA